MFFKRNTRSTDKQTPAERKAQRREDRVAWREAKAQAGPLPDSVLDIIDAAAVNIRSTPEGEVPRVVVNLPGRNPFRWNGDEPSKAISRCFPELSDTHARMALSRLSSVVAARSIIQSRPMQSAQTRWVDRY